ncbi:MAG: type II secretion system F family protein [Hyphomicrobiales bacterium]|nr:type II secretion system F family protein [Hyphomicrobiales bacterium]
MTNEAMEVALFAFLGVVGLGYVFIPMLNGEDRVESRKANLVGGKVKQVAVRNRDEEQRRKQVAESLKELDQRHDKKVSLETLFSQAGVKLTRGQFYLLSTVSSLVFGFLVAAVSHKLILAPFGLVFGFIVPPKFVLKYLVARRMKAFIDALAPAIDIIVRGIKSGLPLGDCMKIIASEGKEPVRGEFKQIVDSQAVGLTATEAVQRMVERVPLPEANFFAIVIAVQAKAGGNLAEALMNLSRVLRERKKMKQKIKAMSSEAKSSAGIIGALPVIVTGLIYVTSPKYIEILFTTTTGNIVIAASLFWMFLGIMVMKKMINFDF